MDRSKLHRRPWAWSKSWSRFHIGLSNFHVFHVNFVCRLTGGKSESNANLAEGMATTLVCFDDMNEMRDDRFMQVQKHCILICNSAPYSMPVQECQQYENKTVEQMATIFHEVCFDVETTFFLHRTLIASLLILAKCQPVNYIAAEDWHSIQIIRESRWRSVHTTEQKLLEGSKTFGSTKRIQVRRFLSGKTTHSFRLNLLYSSHQPQRTTNKSTANGQSINATQSTVHRIESSSAKYANGPTTTSHAGSTAEQYDP